MDDPCVTSLVKSGQRCAKEQNNYLRQGRYVLLSVCLFLYLLATSRKTTDHIFMKLLPKMYL